MQNEGTRQDMEAAKESAEIDQMNAGLQQQMGTISKSVASTTSLTSDLVNEEDQAARNLNEGLQSLDSARVIG